MKKIVLVAAILSTAATIAACRRETPHEPMKLGADVPVASQVAR